MSAVHSYMGSFDHIVFDLDDTILDTHRQLIPRASRASCEAMIEAGLNADLAPCLAAREDHLRTHPREDLYVRLIERFGVRDGSSPEIVARVGHDTFYNREVETDIVISESTRELLSTLSELYGLHLVTAGHRPTQEAKVRILGIAHYFDGLHYVDPARGERKRDAFATIMKQTSCRAERYLSVGNRLDTDIGPARELGWQGCWLKYGEYASMEPSNAHEKPNYTIKTLEELVHACQL